jgi:hypothetical protein
MHKKQMLLFTGETRFRYIEDTLTYIGAPNGSIIHFDYDLDWISIPQTNDIENKYQDTEVLLVSYTGKISEKKWLILREAKIISVKIVEKCLHIAIRLDELIACQQETIDLIISDPEFTVTEKDHIMEDVMGLKRFFSKSDFINICDKLTKFSESFKGSNVIFSKIYFESTNGNEIKIINLKNYSNVGKFNTRPYIEFDKMKDHSELVTKIFTYCPNISNRGFYLELNEDMSKKEGNKHRFMVGERKKERTQILKLSRGFFPRICHLDYENSDSNSYSMRLKFQTQISFSYKPWIQGFIVVILASFSKNSINIYEKILQKDYYTPLIFVFVDFLFIALTSIALRVVFRG